MKWDIFMLRRYLLETQEELVGSTVFSLCFNRVLKSFYPCKRRRPDGLPLGFLGLLI